MLLSDKEIRLRKVEPEDLPFIYLIENDDKEWGSGDTHNPLSQKDLRDYIEASTGDIYRDGQLRLIIEINDDSHTTIGLIDLFDVDVHNQRLSLGIYIAKDFRRNGYARKAIELIEQYVFSFLHFRLIYVLVSSVNVTSKSMFEKLQYQRLAILSRFLRDADIVLFAKYAE